MLEFYTLGTFSHFIFIKVYLSVATTKTISKEVFPYALQLKSQWRAFWNSSDFSLNAFLEAKIYHNALRQMHCWIDKCRDRLNRAHLKSFKIVFADENTSSDSEGFASGTFNAPAATLQHTVFEYVQKIRNFKSEKLFFFSPQKVNTMVDRIGRLFLPPKNAVSLNKISTTLKM